jgi:hypothetical protein
MSDLLETIPPARLAAPDAGARAARSARNRGRPLLMSRAQVLDRIRDLAQQPEGLFRVHHQDTGLYARARRQFGSWEAAVRAAGVDYGTLVQAARRRSLESRRTRRGTR